MFVGFLGRTNLTPFSDARTPDSRRTPATATNAGISQIHPGHHHGLSLRCQLCAESTHEEDWDALHSERDLDHECKPPLAALYRSVLYGLLAKGYAEDRRASGVRDGLSVSLWANGMATAS
jgi:hypothetical protein